jgi:hypothetical protein
MTERATLIICAGKNYQAEKAEGPSTLGYGTRRLGRYGRPLAPTAPARLTAPAAPLAELPFDLRSQQRFYIFGCQRRDSVDGDHHLGPRHDTVDFGHRLEPLPGSGPADSIASARAAAPIELLHTAL